MGWRTPCSRTELVRSSRPALSIDSRGWFGLAVTLSTGMFRTAAGPTMVVSSALRRLRTFWERPCVLSSLSRAVAAARKFGLAKRDYLLGEIAVVIGGIRGACVCGDRQTGQRGFSELHGVADDGSEDVVIAVLPHLIEH